MWSLSSPPSSLKTNAALNQRCIISVSILTGEEAQTFLLDYQSAVVIGELFLFLSQLNISFLPCPCIMFFFYCFLPSLLSSSVGHGRWRRMSLLKEYPSMDSTCSRPFCFNKINMTIITTALRQITVCMCGCFLSLCLNGIKGDVLRIRGVDVGGLISFSSLFILCTTNSLRNTFHLNYQRSESVRLRPCLGIMVIMNDFHTIYI